MEREGQPWYKKIHLYTGAFFASLWTPETYIYTAGTLGCAYVYGPTAVVYYGSSTAAGKKAISTIGQPHGVAAHQAATVNKANEVAQSGRVGQHQVIYYNRALKTAGLQGSQRPDAIVVGTRGTHIIEVVSPSQIPPSQIALLRKKLDLMLQTNPGTTGEVINPYGR